MTLEEEVDTAADGEDRVRRSEKALQGIYEISKMLTRPARIEATLSNVAAALSDYFQFQNGLIVLLDEKEEPRIAVGPQWDESSASGHLDHLPNELIRRIKSSRLPVVDSENTNILLGVPVMDRERVIGTISVESLSHDPSADIVSEETNILSMVANLVGQTVRVQNLVTRDRERIMDDHRRAEKELETQAPKRDAKIAGIVGESSAVQSILNKIRIVARSHLPVLLRGESGTGKELFAQAVHDLSPRKKGPLVKVNCAALPESMLESELFGHEKGAFTGALTQRKGRFELADGGTLFLDEIGEISPGFQAKLLRVLQEGEFQRVGGTETTKVDVRLVAATNRNLEEAVSAGEFRADLYFRISVVPILLAPLRERREDIPLLAREFLRRYNEMHGTAIEFSDEAMELLCECEFPGNIRELESCVRRTAAFAESPRIAANDFACQNDSCLSSLLWKKPEPRPGSEKNFHLPISEDRSGGRPARTPVGGLGIFRSNHNHTPNNHPHTPINHNHTPSNPAQAATRPQEPVDLPAADALPDADGMSAEAMPGGVSPEKDRLIEAMERAGWVQAKAARLLGLSSRQMGYALRKHGIEIKRF